VLLSSILNVRGHAETITGACHAGIDIVGYAKRLIDLGVIDAAVVVAADNELCELAFNMIGSSMPSEFNGDPVHASRPFDIRSGGTVSGENAGALFVESLEHAHRRHARQVYAKIAGYAKISIGRRDFGTLISDGPAKSMADAMNDAGWTPADVSLVVAHGSGSVNHDHLEAVNIANVFPATTKVNSVKGITGETGAGCSILQVSAACLCLRDRVVFGTANFEHQGKRQPLLNIVRETHDDQSVSKVLCNVIGVGAFQFSSLALERIAEDEAL